MPFQELDLARTHHQREQRGAEDDLHDTKAYEGLGHYGRSRGCGGSAGIKMISVSAGRRSPSWRARGSRTLRLCAVRTRRSRSARRPSSDARSARRSVSARAALRADVCRAITAHSAASNATSQKAIQWRPLNGIGRRSLEAAELRRSRPGVGRDLVGRGGQGFLRQHAPEGPAPAGAYRLPRRTDTVATPFPKRVLHDAVFTGMIGDDAQPAAGDQRVAQRGQRRGEKLELLIHGDAERLEQAREIGRTRARAQDGADRIHEIVADREGGGEPAPDDLFRQRTPATLVSGVRKHRAEPLSRPRVQDIPRGYSPPPFPRPLSPHSHIERRAGPKGESALQGVDLM